MHTTEPIHFSVVPFRTDDNEGGLEFRALVGPKAAKYVQNAREARKWGFRLG